MAIFLYTFVIRLYTLAIRIFSLFRSKAKLWVEGRRNWPGRLSDAMGSRQDGGKWVWVHCASLGEFEQGRPVIEGLKFRHPEVRILLTFFSPSGYEIRKDYLFADHICYLPADLPANARNFLDIARPSLVIFVKYEFWFHFLTALFRRGIPVVLISALFRKDQLFFRWYGKAFLRLLPRFEHLFLQNQSSAGLLQQWGVANHSIAGDTRIDRVLQIAGQVPAFSLVESFTAGSPVLIAGSTWPADEEILAPFLNNHLPASWKVIIAPHHIREEGLAKLERSVQLPAIRYSEANLLSVQKARILLIDNIGMLASLYQYGRIAYIGGGFGAGIHNMLEPAAFGLPVIFGPRFRKFEEAVRLTEQGGAFAIQTSADFQHVFFALQEDSAYRKASAQVRSYLQHHRGATGTILEFLDQKLEKQ